MSLLTLKASLARHRRQALLLLSCSFLGALALDSRPAWAVTGFNLGFGIENWTLTRGVNTVSEPINTPDECSIDTITACISPYDSNSSAIIGSGPNPIVPPSAGQVIETTWTWKSPDNSPKYFISFRLFCDTEQSCDGAAPSGYDYYATFKIGSNPTKGFSGENFAIADNEVLNPGETITFTIYQPINTGLTSVSIENFNAAVPTPLPAAGAASAFSFSRRLRRRVKSGRGLGPLQQGKSLHPGAYLNLPATALGQLPLSFSYSTQAAWRLRQLPHVGSPSAVQHGNLPCVGSLGTSALTT